MQFSYYNALNIAAGVLAAGLAAFAWNRRAISGAKEMLLLLLSIAWWDFGLATEYLFTDVPSRIFWTAITYPGAMFSSVFYILFIIRYTQQHFKLSVTYKILLSIIPLASCVIAWLPEQRKLLWPKVTMLDTSIGLVAEYKHGLWFWIEIIYSYLLILAGIIILFRSLMVFSNYFQKRSRILLVASVFPLFTSLLYSFFPNVSKGVDLTSLSLTITCLLLIMAMFNFRLLDLKPIARNILIDQMNDGIIVLDNENIIVDINPKALEYIGYTYPVSPIGRSTLEVFKKQPSIIETFKAVYEIQTEIKININHQVRHFNIQITPLKDNLEKIVGRSVVFRDITEYKKNEEEIIRINQELIKSNETKDKLFRIVAHDIKSPVASLKLLLEVMSGKPNASLSGEHLEMVKQTTTQLYDLIDNLLNWARSQRDEIQLDKRENDLHKIVLNTVDLVKNQANSKQIKIINLCSPNIKACFDQPTITIVVRNLLNNSIKFTPKGGLITLNLEDYNKDVRFTIMDTGVGMSDEMLDNIFKKHKSVSTTGTLHETGSGFGLVICRDLVNRNGGKMWATSLEGKGTSISFSLPLKDGVADKKQAINPG